MLKVGYPDAIGVELLQQFPSGIELVPVPATPAHEIALDVWIAPPVAGWGRKVWPHLRGVKTVLALTAGTEWITEVAGPSVTVCNAQGAHNVSTAEWTVGAILAMLKYFPLYRDLQNASDWRGRSRASQDYSAIHNDHRAQYPPILQEELNGKRVLIVGYGDIGKTIERYLAPYDVELTRVARSARTNPKVHSVSELDRLLPEAEIVILILPHTPESHGLIGAAQIGLMQQGALLVNAARGPIVQTDALVEALNSWRIRAAIDVTDPEPLPSDHPLWKCPNLLITPHVAGSTPQFSARAMRIAAEQVTRLISGQQLINVVQQGTATVTA
ncbi:2-hydroxyacid dehydrogenase [Acidicapsa dinghuensis]|uniref:2-hydroxyacid dehydrogenase n=1 Tax=Acidicapsa dinghuensis TaxID=2218256 RepID=A0ABW1EEK3_9BACT|nr:2-hydroxyacid dehydrogenase [Acidicapsa dinghuensis]